MNGTEAEALLRALQRQAAQHGQQRLERAALWRAYASALPVEASGAEARPRLVALLGELERQGALKLPRGAQGWDRTAVPPFPEWALLVRRRSTAGSTRPPGPDLAAVPWAPELAFATTLGRGVGEETYQILLAVQRFLAEGGRRRPLVPLRERSLQLFGDEKKLEKLVRSKLLFGPGRLSLELLRCVAVAAPLVWLGREAVAAEGPSQGVLVLENHHTFTSFCWWNQRCGAYAAIVYGAGNHVTGAVDYLAKIAAEVGWTGPIDYFGDLDPAGLTIAAEAAEQAVRDGLPALRPAARWYSLLVARAEQNAALPAIDPEPLRKRWSDWLPAELRERVAALFAAGRRAPQELVGWEELRELPAQEG